MKACFWLIVLTVLGCCAVVSPVALAQNSIQLFPPADVRLSASGTSAANPADFNSNTLSLTCPATPAAVLSSAPSGVPASSTGYVLADNYILVTVTTPSSTSGPTNICPAGLQEGDGQNDCFSSAYQNNAATETGVDPDTLLPGGGVAPIDISSHLVSGSQTLKIDMIDEGGYLASSTLYLNTNCSNTGVSAPALISGNNIPPNNPTPSQLTQTFTFNPVNNNQINFVYNLNPAQSAGTLTINPQGSIPQVGDSAIDPTRFQSVWATGTPFATSSCFIHFGETLSNGNSACKLFTLECNVGQSNSPSGAQCPVSSQSNEVLQDIFDGPTTVTLPDITTVVNGQPGPTFHQGMGFLMASEGWIGGGCTFDPLSGLENMPCPQNLLTSFTGPGSFNSNGATTHPNSTFITISNVPEPLTTVSVANMQPGNWVKTNSPQVTFSSQAPNLAIAVPALPNAGNFIPSPIQSINYGITPVGSVPTPPAPVPGDPMPLVNAAGCPTPANPTVPAALPFTPPAVTLSGLSDGNYLIHYYAQDCSGTQELLFTKDGSGVWATNFFTYPLNVDTTVPQVSGPTLSPSTLSYYQGQPVTASFSCSDSMPGSGIVSCGGQSFASGTASTGPLTATVDTSTPGSHMFTVIAKDAAGNTSSQSVTYSVNVDSQIKLTFSPTTITYPLGTNVTVTLSNLYGHVPTGTIQLIEKGTPLASLTLGGGGAAYYYLSGLSAGTHAISAVYSGDKYNPAGTSAPVTLTVLPVPVTMSLSCWNTPYPYGATFQCGVYASSNAGAPLGNITYTYDGGAATSLPLVSGSAMILVTKPQAGNHTLVVNYPAQTNYAAAGPKTENFVVTAAPIQIQLTPSSWYLTGGNLTLSAAVQSWSAGPPNATGQIAFTDGSLSLGTFAVNASGIASVTVPASTFKNGNQTITATYSGGTNYATGSTTVTIQVAH
ncbi:MAG TPA: Ig-like domain repeat protein [Terracidiphilus sp.]|jgi:hypothetical protein|nr:Ig-like domain repeat protein [Terracidiphilus sp.]